MPCRLRRRWLLRVSDGIDGPLLGSKGAPQLTHGELRMRTETAVPAENWRRLGKAPDPYLQRIRDVVYQVAGIFQSDENLPFLEECARKRMQAVDANSLRQYYDRLTVRRDREAELHRLVGEMNLGETCFFRNPLQLEALRRVVLPAICQDKNRPPCHHVRVWSAGCATGEEPYSLAMSLMEAMEAEETLQEWTFEVLATDWNNGFLEKAKEGIYSLHALRHVPPSLQQKCFRPCRDQFQVTDEVKAMVSFHPLNLLEEHSVSWAKDMDAIFCCNVLIHFDGSAQRRTIQRFHDSLLPNGYLFVGNSESLYGVSDNFRLVHFPGSTAYRKVCLQSPAAGVI